MANYWIQLDLETDRDLEQVTRLAAETVMLAGLDEDVEVIGVAVTRWTDEDEADDPTLVPAGEETA